MEKQLWRILGINVNSDIERKLENLKDWIEEKDKRIKTMIGGDFNARTGTSGGWEDLEEGKRGWRGGRKAKDSRINGVGRKLVEFNNERG